MNKICVVGAGKMGQAFLRGFQANNLQERFEIHSSCKSNKSKAHLEQTFSWPVHLENSKAVKKASVVILGVKPFQIESVLKEISPQLNDNTVVISLAAGITLEQIHRKIPHVKSVVRVMPNLPDTLGKGVIVYATSSEMDSESESRVEELLLLLGQTFKVPERLMDAAAALSGGAPAYVGYFIEALTLAGVKLGFSQEMASEMVIKSFYGSSEMLYTQKDLSAATMMNQVCTPGGTTIEGIGQLEEAGVKGAVLRAVTAAAEKSAFLGGRKLFSVSLPALPESKTKSNVRLKK